ncbi:ExeA family protein [Syntrophorhabdus aromaticivorans]|uniref:AAA family ATPase n=1 Tax=Syntrophorhabdus aromaticivorans TaxID=328301 RepID=A0A971M6I6_9BACT|nr:AAA family ATPase [Syntrophorhabdus aromaticivorans]NLW36026.1 AAA family ATPase [Syntrophorhabdus aromaticivorans]
MYYEYWGLKKPPFDNVPDPLMYVSSHTSVENTIAETLFAIEEGNECISVIVGDVGLGKTMSLRMVIDSLDQDKYKIAFITNPDIPFIQLLREIIGQLTGKQCEERRKVDLLETFNKLLFQTVDEGRKVLIFIDEANAMSPANLESLRLLTNMQDDSRNLFTIVLAGQIELARRLEHPKRANLFQRIGTYCTIEKIESEEIVRNYIETRLSLAGAARKIFTDSAISSIWVHSESGVPRLINKICKLCLKAGETNNLHDINGGIVTQIAERFQKLSGPAMPQRKPRPRFSEGAPSNQSGDAAEKPAAVTFARKKKEPERPAPITFIQERKEPEKPAAVTFTEEEREPERPAAATLVQEEREPEKSVTVTFAQEERKVVTINDRVPQPESPPPPEEPAPVSANENEGEEVAIAKYGINVIIPPHVIEQAHSFTEEHRARLAGVLAAQTMQKHPQLTVSIGADPVMIWSDIRECILLKLRQGQESAAMQG